MYVVSKEKRNRVKREKERETENRKCWTYETNDQTDQNDQTQDIGARSIGNEKLLRLPRRHPLVIRCLKRKVCEIVTVLSKSRACQASFFFFHRINIVGDILFANEQMKFEVRFRFPFQFGILTRTNRRVVLLKTFVIRRIIAHFLNETCLKRWSCVWGLNSTFSSCSFFHFTA